MGKLGCIEPGCHNTFEHNGTYTEAHAAVMILQKCTPTGYSSYQCDQGELVDGHKWQHWNCGHGHMMSAMRRCLATHYDESKCSAPPPGNIVTFHNLVLSSGLKCVICNQPLTNVAIRFVIQKCLPVHFYAGNEDFLAGWADTYQHAVAAANQILSHLDNLG